MLDGDAPSQAEFSNSFACKKKKRTRIKVYSVLIYNFEILLFSLCICDGFEDCKLEKDYLALRFLLTQVMQFINNLRFLCLEHFNVINVITFNGFKLSVRVY